MRLPAATLKKYRRRRVEAIFEHSVIIYTPTLTIKVEQLTTTSITISLVYQPQSPFA